MLYKGVLITQASGRIDDAVFSHNRGGPYVRALGNPNPNPPTEEQTNQRLAFKNTYSAWTDLTAAERSRWDQLGLDFPTHNRIGDIVRLKGIDCFTRANFYRQHVNQTSGLSFRVVTEPPSAPIVPWDDAWIDPAHNFTWQPASGDIEFGVDPTTFPIWSDNDMAMLWYYGQPLTATQHFYKSPMTLYTPLCRDTDSEAAIEYGVFPGQPHAKQKLVAFFSDGSISQVRWIDANLYTP